MRKLVFLALTVFSVAAVASAQIPTGGNIYIGYSYFNTNMAGVDRQSLNGWEGSLEGKFFPFIGIVADFSANYGDLKFPVTVPVASLCAVPCPTSANVNSHVDNFLLGPRLSFSVGRVRPFAEAMFGASHINTNGFGSDTSFATALGGGLDYNIFHLLAWRFEGDFIRSSLFHTTQHNARFTTGIVLHF
jgi:Outer membrane protein beta-barrel domain